MPVDDRGVHTHDFRDRHRCLCGERDGHGRRAADVEMTPDEIDMACDWTDYRSDYGVAERDIAVAHKAFTAGWLAARHGSDRGVLT